MEFLNQRAKIVWMAIWLAIATLLLFIPITLAALLSRTGNLAFNLSKIWAWMMILAGRVELSVRGSENIKKGQSYIIISNHQSHFDIPALVTQLGIQFRWIIKKELLKAPLFGYALYASRNIFIDRSNREKSIESIQKGINRLPPGTGVMFFAEGTRSPDGRIHDFKKGGFITAIAGQTPVLPISVNGSRKVMPKKSAVVKPGRIEVVIGEPIDTSGYTHDGVEALMAATRKTILANFDPDF